jgi:hypothetical protein
VSFAIKARFHREPSYARFDFWVLILTHGEMPPSVPSGAGGFFVVVNLQRKISLLRQSAYTWCLHPSFSAQQKTLKLLKLKGF